MTTKRVYQAAWYQENRDERLAYQAAYNSSHREEIREKDARRQRWFTANLNILRRTQGCDDCGTHEGKFEHHHLDPDTKKYQVSRMYNYSLNALCEEIAKCTVLCLPHHRKRHAEMRPF